MVTALPLPLLIVNIRTTEEKNSAQCFPKASKFEHNDEQKRKEETHVSGDVDKVQKKFAKCHWAIMTKQMFMRVYLSQKSPMYPNATC